MQIIVLFDRWLKHHQAIVQLSLRAVAETAQLKEERVYAQFMSTDKVSSSILLITNKTRVVMRERILLLGFLSLFSWLAPARLSNYILSVVCYFTFAKKIKKIDIYPFLAKVPLKLDVRAVVKSVKYTNATKKKHIPCKYGVSFYII